MDLIWSLVITPENFMMIWWWEHSQKGVIDRRTGGQTVNTICRAAWSQLKTPEIYWIGRNNIRMPDGHIHICPEQMTLSLHIYGLTQNPEKLRWHESTQRLFSYLEHLQELGCLMGKWPCLWFFSYSIHKNWVVKRECMARTCPKGWWLWRCTSTGKDRAWIGLNWSNIWGGIVSIKSGRMDGWTEG